MKFRRFVTFLIGLLVALELLSAADIDPGRYLSHIKYLASEELKGRGDGTPQLEKAAHYIERQFRNIGLRPAAETSYFQSLKVTTNAKLGPENHLEYADGKQKRELKSEEDFRPFGFSASGSVAGGIVFVGYGITAREYNYDDYGGVNAKDKIVLVLRHEPQEFDEKSVFGGKIYTTHAQLESKAINAKFHGALGVIFVNDRPNHPSETDELEKFSGAVGPANPGIPFVQVKTEIAEHWLVQAGRSLEEITHAIDRDLRPQSFALPDSLRVELEVDVEHEVRTVHNVVGYLPGETSEYLIIGAHYDHLGLGEQFSMAPSMVGTPHPGADDNASGTAGVIELARWFARQPKRHRGILFLAFAAEEMGLLGSSYYVNHPLLPLDKAVAMINMDMIGRVRQNKVYIGGAGTGSNLREILEGFNGDAKLNLDFTDTNGYGSSDHYSFTPKQIPVLFFFSGLHSDYHKPSDTWDKIDAPAAAKLLDFIAEVSEKLIDEPGRPQFVKVEQPNPHHAGLAGSSGSGYGPYFGSVPDFGQSSGGVKFADIRAGSPADKAGVRAGDILIEFDGKPIDNLYDFTYALRSKAPGDEVLVKIRRGDRVIETKAVLAERK
jgi:aminopeptidase YwaD